MRILDAPNNGEIIVIGKQGENLASRVRFVIDETLNCVLLHQRYKDKIPYQVELFENGIWTVTDSDTSRAGLGKVELQMRNDNGLLIKSETYNIKVEEALASPGAKPDPHVAWADRIVGAVSTIEQAQEAADDAKAETERLRDEALDAKIETITRIEEAEETITTARNDAEHFRDEALEAKNSIVANTYSQEVIDEKLDTKSDVGHTHEMSDVDGLEVLLDTKSDINHVHNIYDVANLQTALNNKASVSHTHSISSIPNLQNSLDSKASLNHTHSIGSIPGLTAELGSKAAAEDVYTKEETNDLIPTKVSELENDEGYATESFVNSSIGTNTANYISKNGTPFESLEALQSYTDTLTNNDYAFVIGQDSSGNVTYTRYKYNASTSEWAEEYVLNNSSFTDAQWQAISSGITSDGAAQIISNKENIEALEADLDSIDASKMSRYIIKLVSDGTAYSIKKYETDVEISFEELKAAISDKSNYVVCVYGNTKIRPQYVGNSEVVFTGLSRDASGADAIRMIVRPTGVSYDVYPLQQEGDFVTETDFNTKTDEIDTELISQKEHLTRLDGVIGENPASDDTAAELMRLLTEGNEGFSSLVDLCLKLPQETLGNIIIDRINEGTSIVKDILTELEGGLRYDNL